MTAPTWTLYDRDYKTSLGTLHPLPGANVYLKQNDTGTGSVTIPFTDSLYSQVATKELAIWKYIDLTYNSTNPFGFFIENWEAVEASSAEGAGRAVTLSGRGRLSILSWAKVWDWQTPGNTDTRYFGTADTTSGYGTIPVPKGLMLWWLLSEARDVNQNLAGVYLARTCWRWPSGFTGSAPPVASGTIQLDWDFTTTTDSASTAWSDAEDMQFQVGSTSLLDVVQQIAALQYDFAIDFNPASGFMLHAYNARKGTDRHSSVVFSVGTHIIQADRRGAGGELANAHLVEFSDPANPFVAITDTTSITAYGRHEGFIPCSNATTSATATNFGTVEEATTKDPKPDDAITVADGMGTNHVYEGTSAKHVFTDYALPDTVGYNNGIASTISYPLTGMNLVWLTEDTHAQITLEHSAP